MKKFVKTLLTLSVIGLLVCTLMTSCGKHDSDDDSEEEEIVETKTDITGVTFEDAAFAYDGEVHSLAIGGTALPSGVNVAYTNNDQTEIGVYTVVASFTDTTNKYNVPNDMTATLTIYDATVYYDVTFIVDGAEVETRSVRAGSTLTELPTIPSKNGYSSNWSYDGEAIIGNTQITAVYTIETYTIEYNLLGGTNPSTNLSTYTVLSNLTFAEPTQEGCEFEGWYLDSSYTTAITSTEGYYENLVLYAKWERSVYTITYVLNGGTQAEDAITTFEAGVTETLPTPTYTGYTFAGWSTNPTAGTLPEGTGIETTEGIYESITLYAYWYTITYYITYDYGVVNEDDQPRMYTVEDTIVIAEGAVPGYEFNGWTSEDLGITTPQSTITINPHTIAADITIHGNVGDAITYTITYELNDGTVSETLAASYTKDETYTFPEATKTNYEFVGWYLLDSDGNPYVKITSTSSVYANITVRAIFEEITHSITYRGNILGYTNPNSSVTSFTESSTYTFLDPSATGYNFVAWYTDSSYETVITSTEGITADLIVYAKFENATYNITYEGCDGATNTNPSTYTYNTTVNLTAPTKDGYTFAGWTSTELGVTTPQTTLSIPGGITGDITLTATWTVTTYTVTYVDYDTTTDTFSVEDYDMKEVTAQDAGYEFVGWYTGEIGTGELVTTLQGIYEDITLYAYIPTIQYTITYNLDGGTNNSDNPSYYTVNDSNIYIKDPTKEGYTFDGWTSTDYTTATKYPNVVISTQSLTNVILTANWTLATYHIYYDLVDCMEVIDDTIFDDISTYQAGDVITFPTLTFTHYTFDGWYLDTEYTEAVTSTEGLSGNLYVYAKTTATEYTITIVNSFDGSTYDTITYTYTDIELLFDTTPTLDGYTFVSYEYNGVTYSTIDEETGCYIYIDFEIDFPGNATITINWTAN